MGSSFGRFGQLRGIERELHRSEPHMTAMLAIFAKLYAGETIISCEQERPAAIWERSVLAVLAATIADFAGAGRWVISRIACGCAATCRRLSRAARVRLAVHLRRATPTDLRRSLGL